LSAFRGFRVPPDPVDFLVVLACFATPTRSAFDCMFARYLTRALTAQKGLARGIQDSACGLNKQWRSFKKN